MEMNSKEKAAAKAAIDGFNTRLMRATGLMTYPSWVVLQGEMQMTRDEIMGDPILIKVFVLWAEDERSPEALRALLEVNEAELVERVMAPITFDQYIEYSIETAEDEAKQAA